MKYEEYLQTEHWKAMRAWALERSERRCQLCGERHDLEVHHNTYLNLGHERPADLFVLCARCHERNRDVLHDPGLSLQSPPEPSAFWPVVRLEDRLYQGPDMRVVRRDA